MGPGVPVASLCWETELLDMELRIFIEMTMLVLHIRGLKEDTLAKKIYYEQRLINLPGLACFSKQICELLDIEDCNITNISKTRYRILVTRACHVVNESRLRKMAENKEKCVRILKEGYGKKKYLSNKNIHQARLYFKTRVSMMPFAGNFSHDKRFLKSDWLCQCEQEREKEDHLLSGQCPVYGDLISEESDFSQDDELVRLFTHILARRERLEESSQ